MPNVSIVIPTFNREETIQRALDSVFQQTYDDFEAIVVDDCSTDDTLEVIKKYQDSRLQFYRFEENRGANAARNKGISLARGKYISFLDSDDKLHPEHIEQAVSTLESNSHDVAGVFTSYAVVEDGKTKNIKKPTKSTINLEDILSSNIIGGFSCTTFRKMIFQDIGYLDEELPSNQDWDFYIRVLSDYKMVGLSSVLLTIHTDTERISGDIDRRLEGKNKMINKHGEKLTNEGIANLHDYCGYGSAKRGEYRGARKHFMSSIKASPTRPISYTNYLFSFPLIFPLYIYMKRELNKLLESIK
jgi:glycosyltransferase involved in cell wall biosynthesis